MELGPNTRSYDIWKKPPIPMSMDIYFFNWTNPCNFTNDEYVKPILREVGPYRFTEVMDKVDVDWHPDNATVSFRKKSTYFFDEAGSKGRLDDTITTLNIIALVSCIIITLKRALMRVIDYSRQQPRQLRGAISTRKVCPLG